MGVKGYMLCSLKVKYKALLRGKEMSWETYYDLLTEQDSSEISQTL